MASFLPQQTGTELLLSDKRWDCDEDIPTDMTLKLIRVMQ